MANGPTKAELEEQLSAANSENAQLKEAQDQAGPTDAILQEANEELATENTDLTTQVEALLTQGRADHESVLELTEQMDRLLAHEGSDVEIPPEGDYWISANVGGALEVLYSIPGQPAGTAPERYILSKVPLQVSPEVGAWMLSAYNGQVFKVDEPVTVVAWGGQA